MRRIGIILALVFLSACMKPITPDMIASPTTLTPAQKTHLEAGIRTGLKDPGSAQFGELAAAIDSNGLLSACGYVNAKDEFGDYTGKKPFMGRFTGATQSNFVVEAIGRDEITAGAVLGLCHRRGIENWR